MVRVIITTVTITPTAAAFSGLVHTTAAAAAHSRENATPVTVPAKKTAVLGDAIDLLEPTLTQLPPGRCAQREAHSTVSTSLVARIPHQAGEVGGIVGDPKPRNG
jgi:hypothetical protein